MCAADLKQAAQAAPEEAASAASAAAATPVAHAHSYGHAAGDAHVERAICGCLAAANATARLYAAACVMRYVPSMYGCEDSSLICNEDTPV